MLVPSPPFSFSTTARSSVGATRRRAARPASGSVVERLELGLAAACPARPARSELLVVREGLDRDLGQRPRARILSVASLTGRDARRVSVGVVIATVTEADLAELLPLMRGYCEFYEVAPSDEALLAMSRELIADPERRAFS